MKDCWANIIGGCSNKISGEHIISDSVLEDIVNVSGFDWCKEPKPIGSKKFTSNILCTNHNSALSDSDSEIQKLKEYNSTFNKHAAIFRKHGYSKKKMPLIYKLNGTLLEQWFCKTLINIVVSNKTEIDNIEQIVPFVYGIKEFSEPYGLHYALTVGQELFLYTDGTNIGCEPIFHTNSDGKTELGAGLFTFQGLYFVVILPSTKEPIVDGKLSITSLHKKWQGLTLSWHHREFHDSDTRPRKPVILQKLIFEW